MDSSNAPRRINLGAAWRIWKRFGEMMGNFVARIVLSVFYFTLLAPFGIGMRLFGDALAIKNPPESGWQERRPDDGAIDQARNAY